MSKQSDKNIRLAPFIIGNKKLSSRGNTMLHLFVINNNKLTNKQQQESLTIYNNVLRHMNMAYKDELDTLKFNNKNKEQWDKLDERKRSSVNKLNYDGDAALHLLIKGKNNVLLKKVLELIPYINVNIEDNNGYTPLHLAIEMGNPEVVKLLLAHPLIDVPSYTRINDEHLLAIAMHAFFLTEKTEDQIENYMEVVKLLLDDKHIDQDNRYTDVPSSPNIFAKVVDLYIEGRYSFPNALLEKRFKCLLELFLQHRTTRVNDKIILHGGYSVDYILHSCKDQDLLAILQERSDYKPSEAYKQAKATTPK